MSGCLHSTINNYNSNKIRKKQQQQVDTASWKYFIAKIDNSKYPNLVVFFCEIITILEKITKLVTAANGGLSLVKINNLCGKIMEINSTHKSL